MSYFFGPPCMCMDLIKALSLISSIANIKFLLLYIFNTSIDARNQLCFVAMSI